MRTFEEAMTQAQIDSDMKALTAPTDAAIPAELRSLVGQTGDGWEISAITSGKQTKWVPDGPLPEGTSKYEWSMDRVSGKKVNPPAIQRVEQGYYARVMGCAVTVESWLREKGFHSAFAGSSNSVWIGESCTGKLRLMPGDYHQCDVCDYVTED
jgi:hypothetical protein